MNGGKKIVHAPLRDIADIERFMALMGESISIEGDQRVLGSVLFERVVQSEQAGEVLGVGDQGSPD